MLQPTSPSCTTCRQTDCLINYYCSKKSKVFLENHRKCLVVKPKQTIFFESSIISGIFVISRGSVKLYNTSKNNIENIFRLATSGDILGLTCPNEKQYTTGATTLEETSLCFFEKNIFINLFKDDSNFSLQVLQYYFHELCDLETRYRNLINISSYGKIAQALLIIKNKFGKPLDNGTILLDVNLSKQEIASIAGSCVGETSRALSFFSKQKIVKTKERKITIINQDKLSELIMAECCDIKHQFVNSSCLPKVS